MIATLLLTLLLQTPTATIAWDPPDNLGGQVVSYWVYRTFVNPPVGVQCPGGAHPWQRLNNGAKINALEFTDTEALVGQSWYVVTAVNAADLESDCSALVPVTITNNTRPNPPRNPRRK